MSAICETTSERRIVALEPVPVCVRCDAERLSRMSPLVPCHAVNSPMMTAVTIETPSANAITGQLTLTSLARGMLVVCIDNNSRTPAAATPIPIAPPTTESTPASVRNC